jgi:hypothetical protein
MNVELSFEFIMLSIVIFLSVVAIAIIVIKKLPRRFNKKYYDKKWNEIVSYCKNKEDWPKAIESADDLVYKALKDRRFKGSTRGAKMVSAQDEFSENDRLWGAHNIYKKLLDEDQEVDLGTDIVKECLSAYGSALKDLGAL